MDLRKNECRNSEEAASGVNVIRDSALPSAGRIVEAP